MDPSDVLFHQTTLVVPISLRESSLSDYALTIMHPSGFLSYHAPVPLLINPEEVSFHLTYVLDFLSPEEVLLTKHLYLSL